MSTAEDNSAVVKRGDIAHSTLRGGSPMQAQTTAENPVMGPDAAGEASEVKHRSPAIKVRRGPDLSIEPGIGDDSDDWRVVRFAGHQRAQHFIMMSSVLILVLTGMPQKFFDSPISMWLINFWGGLTNAQTIHHIAGFAMIFSALYHTAYLLYTIIVLKRPIPLWMVPNLKDFRDFWQNTGYYVGVVKEKPEFGRFSYFEKFDYWAVFWGVPVMGLTGLILMYPLIVTRFLPGVTVPVATIAHSDEALLATGWLFVVHFYNAHFAPHIFPFNKSIFTGRVAAKRYRKEHPLEYQDLVAKTEK